MVTEVRNREKKAEERRINKQFDQNPRSVYCKLLEDSIEVLKPSGAEELEGFWRPLFEDGQQHRESDWTALIETSNQQKPAMSQKNVSLDHSVENLVNIVISKHLASKNFQATGSKH